MADSQQLALLRLYNGLARERRASRIKVLDRLGLTDVGEREVLDADSIADFRPSFENLARPADPSERGVLAISKLELLVAFVATLSSDSGGQIDEANVFLLLGRNGPRELIAALVDPDLADPDDAADKLARAIARAAISGLPVGVAWQSDGPIVGTASAALIGTIRSEGIEVVPEMLQQPPVRCTGSLAKVTIDGQGEYAVYLETVTSLDRSLPEFQTLSVGEFEAGLLQPIKWPTYHPFWCSMTKADAGVIGLAPQQLAQLCSATQADHLLLEKVGFCDDDQEKWKDLFPRTFLCFEPRSLSGERTALKYSLIVVPDGALALDDGVITVDARTVEIKVRITKRLYIRALDHRTEGHALAELSCQFGWGDQTRHLIMESLRGGVD